MNLVIIKLSDVFARAAFTVAATYLLTVEQAGQFGLVNSLTALAAFAFGWERHIDVQRRLVAAKASEFDGAVKAMFGLWGLNYLLMLPLLLIAAALLAHIGWPLLLAVALIAVGEQLANAAYNLAVVEPRYRGLMTGILAKNAILLASLATIFLFAPQHFLLANLLWLWAGLSVAGALLLAAVWQRLRAPDAIDPGLSVREQYRASMHHFLIGGLAVLSLQIDRLIVGGSLPLDDVGRYFRHVVLVSLVYQFFNVASYNRRLPDIFQSARTETRQKTMRIILRELGMVGALALVGTIAALAINALTKGAILARYDLSLTLAILLLAGALARVAADFLSLILNARMREQQLFHNQLISFGGGAVLLVLLTQLHGLYGAALAVILAMSLYLLLNLYSVMRLPQEFQQ